MTLGEKLKEARKQAGLSQEQLAEQLIISRSAIAKWESDLGIPDIENLRALAEHLNISMESLLDDSQSLQEARQPAAAVAEPYCGKSCTDCAIREELGCKGCKQTDHRDTTGCAIARCCQGKNLTSCSDCGYHKNCGALRRADTTAAQRLQAHRQEAAKQQRILQRKQEKQAWVQTHAPRLGRWLWAMFCLLIATNVADLLSFVPGLELPATGLNAAFGFLYAACAFPLSPAHPGYRKAALFGMVSALLGLCGNLAQQTSIGDFLQLLVLLPASLTVLAFQYHLMGAFADTVADFDATLSHRWQTLRKWHIGIQLSAPLMILYGIMPALSIIFGAPLLLLLLPIAYLIIALLYLLYLYRTAQLFRTNSAHWLASRAAAAASRY